MKVDVHASQITQWKTQLLEAALGVFLTPGEKPESVGPSMFVGPAQVVRCE